MPGGRTTLSSLPQMGVWRKMAAAVLHILGVYLGIAGPLKAQEKLPEGPAAPALRYNYFPSVAHAVVWRNWNLVSPSRIALVLGCREKDVRSMASSMGLGHSVPVPESYHRRMYITYWGATGIYCPMGNC